MFLYMFLSAIIFNRLLDSFFLNFPLELLLFLSKHTYHAIPANC